MLLGEPEVINDQNRFRSLSKEYAQIEPVVQTFSAYLSASEDLDTAQEMLAEDDAELRALLCAELQKVFFIKILRRERCLVCPQILRP